MITWIATSDLFGRGSQDRPQEVCHLFVLKKIPSLCFQTGEIDGWIDGLLLGMTHDPREPGPKVLQIIPITAVLLQFLPFIDPSA